MFPPGKSYFLVVVSYFHVDEDYFLDVVSYFLVVEITFSSQRPLIDIIA